MSSTLPARLGEPSRALVVARRTGRPRENLPVVLGTLVSQTLLNIVALAVLGVGDVLLGRPVQRATRTRCCSRRIAPAALLVLVLVRRCCCAAPAPRSGRAARLASRRSRARADPRARRPSVFRRPRLGAIARVTQLAAWALQWLSCYMLLVALGLDQQAGLGRRRGGPVRRQHHGRAAGHAANLGVFQAACAAVLHTGWHVGYGDGRRLRHHPAGRRGRDRDPDGHARAAQGGHVLARGPAARDARRAGQAAGQARLTPGAWRRPTPRARLAARGSAGRPVALFAVRSRAEESLSPITRSTDGNLEDGPPVRPPVRHRRLLRSERRSPDTSAEARALGTWCWLRAGRHRADHSALTDTTWTARFVYAYTNEGGQA